jgi:sec-independent protein translocase protein TatA
MDANIPIVRAAFGGLGPWELVIILAIVLIVFGAGKLPKIGSSLGSALKNFKKASDGDNHQGNNDNEGGHA